MGNKKRLLFYRWTICLLGGLIFKILVFVKLIEIIGNEKRKFSLSPNEGLLVIYRHPSLKESGLLPLLFFPRFLFDARYFPFPTPDKRYFSQWWFFLFRPTCVCINQKSDAWEEVKDILRQGQVLIMAPGGSREFKGKRFKIIRDGNIETVKISLPQGKDCNREEYDKLHKEARGIIIQRFKPGIGRILQEVSVPVLPIFVEASRIRLKFIIDEPVRLSQGLSREIITSTLEDILLKTGDR